MTSTTALLYARISITDKNVPKVTHQLADLRDLATSRGYVIAGEYVDDGLSAARAENRPDFDRLLADLPKHPGAAILATEEARFARNEMEKAALMLACVRVGATWETLRDGVVDPATASGALMATLRGGIDAFESRRKAERQKAANLHRRDAGLPHKNGSRPFGWQADRVTLCEPEAELIRQGTAAVLAGRSLSAITRDWRTSSVRPPRAAAWTRVSVLMTLRRWRNAGVVAYKDVPLRDEAAKSKDKPMKIGQWKSIVSVDDLEATRAILMARSGVKRVASRMCSGIALCSCGEYMIASGANGARAYMCSARIRGVAKPGTVHSGIKAELLEQAVREAVVDTYFTGPAGTDASEADARALGKLYSDREVARAAIARFAQLVDAGTFDASEVQANVARRRQEIEALDERIALLAAESAHAAMLRHSFAALWVDAAGSPELDADRVDLRWRPAASLIKSMERAGMNREEAINEAVRLYWRDNKDEPGVREELGRRFDALDLEQQRNLVRSLLRVTVHPGRGVGRIETVPRQTRPTKPSAWARVRDQQAS